MCFGTKYVAVIHTLLGPPHFTPLHAAAVYYVPYYTSIIYAEENECDLRAQLRGSLYLKSSLYFALARATITPPRSSHLSGNLRREKLHVSCK